MCFSLVVKRAGEKAQVRTPVEMRDGFSHIDTGYPLTQLLLSAKFVSLTFNENNSAVN